LGTTDGELMERARVLGLDARLRTPPNPWVGCVIVSGGEIVGEGATRPPGGPHAEVEALVAAGARARGATAYLTLEPCAHHGRTPPCADALIDAGIRRVVTAIEDPDPAVAGAGHARLRAGGIEVVVGVEATGVAEDLAPYLHQRRTGRAFCLCKTAMSLDGRTAAADGSSQWITGPEARADGHRLRAESQAVVVGPLTARHDRPSLTARDLEPAPPRQPLRVLLDAAGHVEVAGPLFDPRLAPTLVVTTGASPVAAREAWATAGVDVVVVGSGPRGRGVDLVATLELLATERGVLQAMVEGGGRLHGALVAEGLVDRLVAYVAPVILGEQGLAVFGFDGPATLADAQRWQVTDCTRLGQDVRLTFDPMPTGDA